MQCLELGLRALVGMAVTTPVVAIEIAANIGRGLGVGDGYFDVVTLARVAHLGVTLE